MNVVIDQIHADLSGASRHLAEAARSVARREVLTSADIEALKRTISNVCATLDRVEVETDADRTGLTVPSAGWEDRNEIAAERAAIAAERAAEAREGKIAETAETAAATEGASS